MPTSNDMRKVLDIQDKHIIFEENCVTFGERRKKKAKFIHCTLTYTPKECHKCGAENTNFTVYKNGTQTSCITFPMSGIYPTYLKLKKQRFMCKTCESSFTAKTPIVEEHCYISNYVKANVLSQSSGARSVKDISEETHVSQATVQRIINKEAKNHKPFYHALPEHLSFDEFKYASGRMAFEYIDVETGDILDILPAKDSRTVKNNFTMRYSLIHRKMVKTVTVDMNASYVSFIPDLFPNAEIIIDRFHIVQLVNRAMNKTRVQVMNQLNTSDGEDQKKYRRLKRYWKKLLKKESDLSYTEYAHYPLFGQRLESAIVAEMLDYDPALKETYDVYQAIIKAAGENHYDGLEKLVTESYSNGLSSYMKTSIKTLNKHLPHIKNTFTFPYTNGRIEGMNNKIKVLNRIAYGYRNFNNYKNRIILHFNLKPRAKQNDRVQTKTSSMAA